MPDDRSEAGRPSWRGKPEPDLENGRHRSREVVLHMEPPGAFSSVPAVVAGVVRRARLFAGLVAFAACLGVVVWLIWMINPPRPAGVVLLGADYATNLAVPHNALGYQGLKGIEKLSRTPRALDPVQPRQAPALPQPERSDSPGDGRRLG